VVVLALFSADSLDNASEIATTLAVIFVMMGFIGLFSILSSRYLLPRLFRRIADNKDVFLIVAIGWAFLFIAIAEGFDLSVEVGAFLAGISLAQLPYSKELEDRITPITDFFILVFFASIGLQIEGLGSLLAFWQEAAVASVVLMVGNFWIMFYLIDREGFSVETSFIGSINMVQVSEFSLVVGALALAQGYIGPDVLGYLTLMALLTMTLSTYIIAYNHAIYERVSPWFSRFEDGKKADREIKEYNNHAVAIGYDEITERALPVLKDAYDDVVVIDRKTDHIEQVKDEKQYEYVFGDFRHKEVRKAANLSKASFVLSSSVQTEVNEILLAETNDEAVVFVEAERIADARRLYDSGAAYVILSTYLTAATLCEYLEQYFTDPSAFEAATQADIERIRQRQVATNDSSSLFESTPSTGGGADD